MSIKTKALSEKLGHVVRTKPVCVQEDLPVGKALELMRQKGVHCLMVCKGSKLTGIFTDRDHLMKVLGRAKGSEPMSAFMTPSPVIGSTEQTVGETVEIMSAKGLRNLPLVDEAGAPTSLVTVDTLIRYLADHFPAAVVNRSPAPHLVSDEADGA